MMWQWCEWCYDISINQNGRTGVKPAKPEYARDPERQKLWQVYQEFAPLIHIISGIHLGKTFGQIETIAVHVKFI